jgi:hypothetical protein
MPTSLMECFFMILLVQSAALATDVSTSLSGVHIPNIVAGALGGNLGRSA